MCPGPATWYKTGPKVVKEWLSHHDTYTLHKTIFRSLYEVTQHKWWDDHQFQADLIDLLALRKYNDGFA